MLSVKELCWLVVDPSIGRKAVSWAGWLWVWIVVDWLSQEGLETTKEVTQASAAASEELRNETVKQIDEVLEFIGSWVKITDAVRAKNPWLTEKVKIMIEVYSWKEYDLLTWDDIEYIKSVLYDIWKAGENAENIIMDETIRANFSHLLSIGNIWMVWSWLYILALLIWYNKKPERIKILKIVWAMVLISYLVRVWMVNEYNEVETYLKELVDQYT